MIMRVGIVGLLVCWRCAGQGTAAATTASAGAAAGAKASGSTLQVLGEASGFTVHGSAGEQMVTSLNSNGKQGSAATTSTILSFSASNEYPAVAYSPWVHLAEPFRETTLTASSTVGDPETDEFVWAVGGADAADATVLEGREVKHKFDTLGRQRVSVSQTVAATGRTYHLEGHVMVKYVRREIRQLTDKDRVAFFDAVEVLYRMPTEKGRKIYGEEYQGIEVFVRMHLEGAGVLDCDHWHDDAGIMTHHVGYTLLFEQALQVVNPAVSVPYWEYTIEAEAGLASYGDSVVFAPDWFGDASPSNAMHTVDNGRFAFLPVMKEPANGVRNAFGLLRAPWNLDPTPYVTRHNSTNDQVKTDLVTCEQYSEAFDSVDLADMNNWLNGGTHGPVHILVGGEWNDPEELFMQVTGYANLIPLVTKYLWRKGYLRLPESCSVEENGYGDGTTCRASCPAEIYESRGMAPYDVLVDVLALYWVGRFTGGVIKHIKEDDRFVVAGHEDDEEFQKAFWAFMLKSFCDPGHVGELFTSSAPYDPLFWVIHPTAERLFNWRRLLSRADPERFAFDETWGYDHGFVAGETGMVCDWSGARQGSLDMPSCVKGICGGHNAVDVLPFKVKINGEVRQMSNIQWMEFIFPESEDLPYLYNEYRWDHCITAGYPMGTAAG